MTGLDLLIVAVVALILLLAIGLEVAFAIGLVGMGGLVALGGMRELGDVGTVAFRASTDFVLTAVPLFVLLGTLLFHSNLSGPMFDAGLKWFGRLRGGPLVGTLAGVGVFSAISGSSTACAATFGKVAIPELEERQGFNRRLVYGTVAAGATLDIMIPPSLAMILYAAVTEQSVGQLFAAGLLPGLLLLGLMAGYVLIVARLRPEWAPISGGRVSWGAKFASLRDLIPAIVLMAVVLGGIYLGVMTPTESAAVGCVAAMLIALVKRQLTSRLLLAAVLDAARLTCFIMLIVVGAYVFAQFVSKGGFPTELAAWIEGLDISRWAVLALIMLMYVVLAAVMESVAILVITLPVIFPTVVALGFDPLWFGVLTVLAVEISLIVPPLGLNLFIIHGVTPKSSPIEDVYAGSAPFIAVLVLGLLIIAAFPELALWLPKHVTAI